MRGREEDPAATQVAVLVARRLQRQALSLWLNGQQDIDLVGSSTGIDAIEQLCERGRVDVVVVGLGSDDDELLHQAATLARRHPKVRLVAILAEAADETEAERLLGFGFRAVVPASAGSVNLLRVVRAGAVVRPINLIPAAAPDLGPLTPREAEVLSLVGQGSTSYDISEQLGISRSTVANHKERIFTKLGANNQAHAVARAVKLGLISPRREEDPRRAG